MDWPSQLYTELYQDEQEEERLEQTKKGLGQLLASKEALLFISQKKHDTCVAYYLAKIAALRRTKEVDINSIGCEVHACRAWKMAATGNFRP